MASFLDERYKRFMQDYSRHGRAYTFVLCGITGALVDIDHIPKILYMLMGGTRKMTGRILHPTFFLIACGICLYFGALLFRSFLVNHGKRKNEILIKN